MLKVGQLVNHSSLKKPRLIKQLKYNSKNQLLVGVGSRTIGWLFAEDCY